MGAFNTKDQYGKVTIVFHWLLFVLITGLLVGGLYSASLPGDEKIPQLIGKHKQIGVIVLTLMLCRLLWKLANPKVRPLVGGFHAVAAAAVHWLLYLAIIAQAFVGIMMSQLSGRAVKVFGWQVPDISGGIAGFADAGMMRELHWIIGYGIVALVVMHIIGAFMHHKNVRRRMWFGYDPNKYE